ncbi:MAG: hypothetical protein LBN02_05030 [Oscillospiraceae bacterium]|jgi:hypothetical protein|nr:hypothetical protein [Oscillospiraceae bacterium]
MIVRACYDDDCDKAERFIDLLDVPERISQDIMAIQQLFFNWLYDKTNDHRYWIYRDGEKFGCSYGSDAFVDWLNTHYLNADIEKATFLAQNVAIKSVDLGDGTPQLNF